MRLRKLLDWAVLAACFFFMVVAAVQLIFVSPFSYFAGIPIKEAGVVSIHSLTILLLSFTALFLWRVLSWVPLISRVLLTVAFTQLAYACYDTIWGFFFLYNLKPIQTPFFVASPVGFDWIQLFPSYLFWLGVPAVILVFHLVLTPRRLPRFRKKKAALVVVLNFLLILWLSSTGFFEEYLLFSTVSNMEIPLPFAQDLNVIQFLNGIVDPHGWIWFVGKAVGMLSWLLVFVDFRKRLVLQKRQSIRVLRLWLSG